MKKTSQQFILGDFLGYTQQIPTISFFLGWLSRDPIPIFPMVLSYSILSAHLRWWCPPTRSKELHNSKLHGAGSNKTIRGWGKDGAFYGILWDSMGMNWKIINSSQTKWIQFLYLKQKINFFFGHPILWREALYILLYVVFAVRHSCPGVPSFVEHVKHRRWMKIISRQ